MGIIKLRKNKKFSYTPRYFDNKGQGSPFEIKHKFDDYRKTLEVKKGLKGKFIDALEDFKNNPDQQANKRIFVIVSILILLFLIFIEFDLSIFFSK